MSSVPDLIALHDESRLQVRRDALLASIGGQWKYTKGSVYDVAVDAWNSCTVATTRPSGAVISTRGLIRLHHDLVADVMSLRWNDTYVLQLGGGRLPTVAWWVPVGRGAAFHWHRLNSENSSHKRRRISLCVHNFLVQRVPLHNI